MFRRFGVSVGILVFLLSAGTVGYMVLEGWTVIDALYMTVITFTTVGYEEVQPLSTAGRIFNIFLIVGGVGAMLYFLTALMSHIVEEEVFHAFVRRRRMRSTLASMRRHYILCGFGRVGREVGRAFAAEGVEFIVIDANDNCIVEAQELGYAYIQGNATEDAITARRGHRARARLSLGDRKRQRQRVYHAIRTRFERVPAGRCQNQRYRQRRQAQTGRRGQGHLAPRNRRPTYRLVRSASSRS